MRIHISTHWWTTVTDSELQVQTHHVVRRLHKWCIYTLQHIDELSWLVENCRWKRVTCVQRLSATSWEWICLNNESSLQYLYLISSNLTSDRHLIFIIINYYVRTYFQIGLFPAFTRHSYYRYCVLYTFTRLFYS